MAFGRHAPTVAALSHEVRQDGDGREPWCRLERFGKQPGSLSRTAAYNTSKASTTTQLLLPAGFHVPVTLMVIV